MGTSPQDMQQLVNHPLGGKLLCPGALLARNVLYSPQSTVLHA